MKVKIQEYLKQIKLSCTKEDIYYEADIVEINGSFKEVTFNFEEPYTLDKLEFLKEVSNHILENYVTSKGNKKKLAHDPKISYF